MDYNSIDLIVDSREKASIRRILDSYGIKYKVETLITGDYEIRTKEGDVTVERKTVTDFIGSLMSGRLEQQMRRLADKNCPILLITGSFNDYLKYAQDSHFTQDMMIGAIASCIVKYGLRSVIWIQSDQDNPHHTGLGLLSKLLIKMKEGKLDKIPPRRLKAKDGNIQAELIGLICGVPSNVSKALLKHFKTPRAIINAKDEDLLKVKGMGKTRVLKMRKLLGDLK